MTKGEDDVTDTEHSGTYRGRHERKSHIKPLGELVDVDLILDEGRQVLLAWDLAPAGSENERLAGMRLGEVFATIDVEARKGNLPVDWRPPSHATWTAHQQGLVTLWGTCHCGGPRDSKYIALGEGFTSVLYCTICGSGLPGMPS